MPLNRLPRLPRRRSVRDEVSVSFASRPSPDRREQAVKSKKPTQFERDMAYISKRCPKCKGTNLSSDNGGNHKCIDCGHRCTDKTCLPSRHQIKHGEQAKKEWSK